MAKREAPCPNIGQHTPRPEGYIEWHAWADEMGKTHHSTQCPGCGRWSIWMPGAEQAAPGHEPRDGGKE